MELVCANNKCLHEWDYKGESKFYATCPQCLHKVKILKQFLNSLREQNRVEQ